MIGRKGPFDAIGGDLAPGKDAGGIVDEHVDLGEALTDLAGKRPNGLLGRHVREQQLGRRPRCNPRHLGPGGCAALGIAADHQNARAHDGELARGDEANAAVGAGDQNCFPPHGATPSPRRVSP